MLAYTFHNKQSTNGSTKVKLSDLNIEELAAKRYPTHDIEVTTEESDIEIYAYEMNLGKIELILPALFDVMHQLYCIETLHASCSTEEGLVDHKLYNMATQRYYARIKNIWNRKEKYIVKMLNLYLFDENCYWVYHKGNIYSINLNDPKIYYIHTVQTLIQKIYHAVQVEKNHSKAAIILIDEIGCTVADAMKILKGLGLINNVVRINSEKENN